MTAILHEFTTKKMDMDEAKIVTLFTSYLADGMATSAAFSAVCAGFYHGDFADLKTWNRHRYEMMRICKITNRS